VCRVGFRRRFEDSEGDVEAEREERKAEREEQMRRVVG